MAYAEAPFDGVSQMFEVCKSESRAMLASAMLSVSYIDEVNIAI